ncbi:MAG: acyl-CoA thioesterase [Phenylobacterium sp.]
MSQPFFELQSTDDPHRWRLPLEPGVCVGPAQGFMFGGLGLAAAMTAMERTCGRPVIWATAQYISVARPPDPVAFDVQARTNGRYTTQVRVMGHVGDNEVIAVNAALGERPGEASRHWVRAPACERPEALASDRQSPRGDLYSRLETRTPASIDGRAADPREDGRTLKWIRPRGDHPVDAAMLAVMADYAPNALSNALESFSGANSLDNTLRIRRLAPTEWVLLDIQIQGVHAGFAYGETHLFAEDGELMATASQSMVVRSGRHLRRRQASGHQAP